MKTEAQDIDMLARAILTEAREEADQIKADAKEKADAIRKRAHEQAAVERKAILDRAQEDAERLRGQSVATAQLKARSLQLTHREQLLDRVFKAVKEKLSDVQKHPDYDQIAATLLREALTELRVNKAEVRADETTQKSLKKSLNEISKELNAELTIGDVLEEGSGVVVDAADGKLHYDNTLETRLNRLQGTLRSTVYQVLIGEKA
ncbi:MAG TPA: V-type ATP synthase subunit E family protein [Anaerolineales bacterium]|jgi:vacuolar-type H+-ATPase subunit E/Vma4|nr:V-type ATP synthase subunit E family protein [Anaerolineales bacterium]